MRRRIAVATQLCLLALVPAWPAFSEASFFQVQSRDDFLAGTLDGLAVDPLGNLSLANRGRRISEFPEPFLFSGATYPGGWVFGTGNSGAVFHVDREGSASRLFETEETEVFAVWADPDGTVFAGSSPDGKVYRFDGDAAEVVFDPEETYIWAIARAADGSLLVGTGTEGRLYRVKRNGEAEVLFDSDDTHIRSLAVLPNGDVLAGTAGEGLIVRISPDGKARTLYDAEHPEVVDFAVGERGEAYAALLASEASLMDLNRRNGQNGQQQDGGNVRVTVSQTSGEGQETTGSRPRGFSGPRSLVVRVSPDGMVRDATQFEEETVYSILWGRDRLWIGTGLDGKLFSWRNGQRVLEKDVEERQLVELLDDDPGPAFATTNAAAFYRISNESESVGTYTSPALDAQEIARFGSLRWRGDLSGGELRISARSGASSRPDRTWSEWTAARSGREIPLSEVPPGRYVQWRAEFTADGGASPVLGGVDISYRQLNLPPRVTELGVLSPGEIVVPGGFNPANQVYEPAHPNRDGIFTGLRASTKREERRRKNLWKKGFRTLTWEVEDPNGDALRYELAFRAEGADGWLPMAEELDSDSYSFDATVLPDGVYRFRLRAFDREEDELEEPLSAERVSEPVTVDHTPPTLGEVSRGNAGFRVVAGDAMSPLRRAEVSVDAGEWRLLEPEDGMLDGVRETLSVEAPSSARLVLLRLTDAAFNVVTYDLNQVAR